MEGDALVSRHYAIGNEISKNENLRELEPTLLTPQERKRGIRLTATPQELRRYLVATFGRKGVPTIAELRKRR